MPPTLRVTTYMWAAVLDNDAFEAFERLATRSTPQRRNACNDYIYSAGSPIESADAYRVPRARREGGGDVAQAGLVEMVARSPFVANVARRNAASGSFSLHALTARMNRSTALTTALTRFASQGYASNAFASINSILYPSGSCTKAMTVLPPLTGPACGRRCRQRRASQAAAALHGDSDGPKAVPIS